MTKHNNILCIFYGTCYNFPIDYAEALQGHDVTLDSWRFTLFDLTLVQSDKLGHLSD